MPLPHHSIPCPCPCRTLPTLITMRRRTPCSPRPPSAVEDFELLGECKATATLALRPGAAVGSWDALVRGFVDAL